MAVAAYDLLLIEALQSFGLLVVLAALFLGFGYAILLKIAPAHRDPNGSYPFYAFAVGATSIFWLMLVLAVFRLLNPVTLGLLIVLQISSILFFWRDVRSTLINDVKALRADYQKSWQESSTKIGLAAVNIVIALMFVMAFALSVLPTIETDSISSYLPAAKLFWQFGGLIDVGNIIGNMAKGGFMPLIYGYALSSSVLSQLLVFFFLLFGATFFHYYLTRHVSLLSGSVAILVLISMGYHADYSFGTAKLDTFSLAFAILALITWHQYNVARSVDHLLVNALTTGFLASLSYLNLAAGFVSFGLIALVIFKQDLTPRQKWQRLLLWSGLTILITMPSYIYNWVEFGSPLYPHASGIFGYGVGEPHLDQRGRFYAYMHELYDTLRATSVTEALSLPLKLWDEPERFQTRHERIFVGFWMVAILGFIWALSKPDRRTPRYMTAGLGTGFAVMYAIWTQQYLLRYFSPAFPFIYWFGAHAVNQLNTYLKPRFLMNAVLIFLAAFTYFYFMLLIEPNRSYISVLRSQFSILRLQNFNTYLSERFFYAATDEGKHLHMGFIISQLRQWLPADAKVLNFLPGQFYLGNSKAVIFGGSNGVTMPSPHSLPKPFYMYEKLPELMRDLRQNNFDYIIIHPRFLTYTPEEKPIFDALFKKKPAFEVDGARVIAVKP